MTCIVHGVKTKKLLREYCAALNSNSGTYLLDAKLAEVEDPSIFKPTRCYLDQLPENANCVVTNHPKRSWFAKIEKINGKLRVS